MLTKTAKKILNKVVEDYNNISGDFDATRQNRWKEFEIFLPHIKNGQFVADLGCGNGRFYKFIKEHRQIHYLGIDNSEKLLEKARKQFPQNSSNQHKFVHGDLLNLPIEDNHIDVAVSLASLHHIPGKKFRKVAVQEMSRILKKDGLLLLTVWNLFQPKYKKYIWQSRIRSLLSFGKYDSRDTFIPWGKTGIRRYYYAFTRKELSKLLEKNGFRIVEKFSGNNYTIIAQKI